MRNKALFLACLALLAAGCVKQGAYPKQKKAVRIVQYNVGAFSKEIDNSVPMVAAMMKEIKADAVSANELDSCNTRHMNNQLADLAGEMGGWDFRFSRAMPYRDGAYGVGVTVRDKIIDAMTVALPKDSGSEPRACGVVETARFVLASTHLDHRSKEAALLQAQTLTKAIKAKYGDSTKPVFLAGDMNSRPESEVLAELAVLTLRLIRYRLHVGEVLLQTRALQLRLLIHELTLGKYHQTIVATLSELAQGIFYFGQWCGGEAQQQLAQLYQLHHDVARELFMADAHSILNERQGKGLSAITRQRQVLTLSSKQALTDLTSRSPRLEQFTTLLLYLVEPRLAIPQCIVGIESHYFDISVIHYSSQ